MIIYHLNSQLQQRADSGQLTIAAAKLANNQLTIDVLDVVDKKIMRLIVTGPKVSNEDIQLIGAKVKNVKIAQYRQIFKTRIFDAYSLECESAGQKFTISAV
jgi:hypothetical protein